MALQPGEVVTYGDVAEVAGYPKLSRLVGHILATTDVDVPWWRVVNAAGRLRAGRLARAGGAPAGGGRDRQRRDTCVDAPSGRFSRGIGDRPAPLIGALDLHERQADVVQRVAHGGRFVTQPIAEAVDQAGDRIDGQRRLERGRAAWPTGGWPPTRRAPSRGW